MLQQHAAPGPAPVAITDERKDDLELAPASSEAVQRAMGRWRRRGYAAFELVGEGGEASTVAATAALVILNLPV